RAELHARYTSTWHDWASLVVYEALPHALEGQLDALRYLQTRRAMDAALERIDRAVLLRTSATPPHDDAGTEALAKLDEAVERAGGLGRQARVPPVRPHVRSISKSAPGLRRALPSAGSCGFASRL